MADNDFPEMILTVTRKTQERRPRREQGIPFAQSRRGRRSYCIQLLVQER
jgi:hypothetical protein